MKTIDKLSKLTGKHMELHEKYQALASKLRSAAEATTITTTNYRPQGKKPTKLTGADKEAYHTWRHAVKTKIETDTPLYLTKQSRAVYAFNQLTGPIFDAIKTWVEEKKETGLTVRELFTEAEHYLSLPSLVEDAKRELLTITMASSELVDEYYHKPMKLWKYAETPEADRTKKFKSTLKPAIANPLLPMTYTNTREVFAAARSIENQKKERATYFSNNKPNKSRPWSANRAGASSAGASTPTPGATKSSKAPTKEKAGKEKDKEKSNAKLTPTSAKPAGWVGVWHESEQHPKKLNEAERAALLKQGRCYSCRDSGHQSTDDCCPRHVKRTSAIQAAEVSNSNSENA
ncbi:hypothetical protein MMC07_009933 [Pseudocyphellaria aurata]|nr:hypothetical protein [Pseudocyphellaria aurata]